MIRAHVVITSGLFFLILTHQRMALSASADININGNFRIATTEQPLAVNLSIPTPYVITTAGIGSGIGLATIGLSKTMNALTMPPTCTKSCRHSAASLNDDSALCPHKQKPCWRLRTSECHNATSHVIMGSLVMTTALLYAYWMNILGS